MNTYKNPIRNKEDYADPFVLRFNGTYYLYTTTPRIDCYSSENLVEWKPEGPVLTEEEFPGLVPFAPEIVYWNGIFYMYTSPHGLGHYVLESSRPTGPFHRITENIGHGIDLSIFIDDDGIWYGYWADERGILGCKMKSPTEFGEPVLVGAYMHGWTEGPFVVKREGRYHLTYTGNHYLSKGYRINTAVSSHPLGPYQDNSCNPVIVRTEGEVTGLGHSSTVLGPDLVTDYIFYHNMKPDLTRGLNMDPVVFRPERAYILGPTVTERPVPQDPLWKEGLAEENSGMWELTEGGWESHEGYWVAKGAFCAVNTQQLPAKGIAEFHLAALSPTEHYGLVFWGKRRLRLEISRKENLLVILEDGRICSQKALPMPYVHEALHEIRVEYEGWLRIYVDGRNCLEADISLAGCRFGYYGDGSMKIGSTAFTDQKHGEGVYPVPGMLPGTPKCTFEILGQGLYEIQGIGCSNPSGSWKVDGKEVSSGYWDGENSFSSVRCELGSGRHELEADGVGADYIQITPYFGRNTEKMQATELGPYDKCCGMKEQTDGEFTARFQVAGKGQDWQAGVLFRASQLADGGEGDDRRLGTNFFIGYRVSLSQQGIRLWKHRYDERLLIENAACGGVDDGEIRLQVIMEQNLIEVYLEEELVIRYRDSEPISWGRNGFHVRDCRLVKGEIF